jgi:hypothetical protein
METQSKYSEKDIRTVVDKVRAVDYHIGAFEQYLAHENGFEAIFKNGRMLIIPQDMEDAQNGSLTDAGLLRIARGFRPNELEKQASGNYEAFSIFEQLMCILIPLIGIVLYFIFVSKDTVKARSALQFAVLGMVVFLIIAVIAGQN